MSGFFTAEDLETMMMYEVTEVAKFLLEVGGRSRGRRRASSKRKIGSAR